MASRVAWPVRCIPPGIERHGYKWRARIWRDGKKLASRVRDSLSDAIADLEQMRLNIPIHRRRVQIQCLEERKGKWRAYFKDARGKKVNGPFCRCPDEAQRRAAVRYQQVAVVAGGHIATWRYTVRCAGCVRLVLLCDEVMQSVV